MSLQSLNRIPSAQAIDLDQLRRWHIKPAPFTAGEPLFWDDPHISAQMLSAHLDPATDLASRRPETVERSTAWMVEALGLRPGAQVLDLGCGPGLYAARLAQRGLSVTGIDISRRSIDYAAQYAREHALDIRYRRENYLALADTDCYEAAVLIYGDYCTLAPEHRRQLLRNVHRALKPGGRFALDVSTREHRKRHGSTAGWYVAESGFWRPGPHLVLEQGFDYPAESVYLDQVVVVEANGGLSVYRMWFQDYTREAITQELAAGGFAVQSVWSDLAGAEYTDDTEWIGVVARKVDPGGLDSQSGGEVRGGQTTP